MAQQRSGRPQPLPQPIAPAVGQDVPVTATAPTSSQDPTAVVGRRFGAVAIDLGILWVFSVVYWVTASQEDPLASLRGVNGACTGRSFCTNVNDRYVAGWSLAILVGVWVAYLIGVFVLQRGLTGRTVGTMLTGVVVVGPDGRPLGAGKALVRSMAGIVDYVPCCLPIVGFTTVLVTRGHRRVGDLAADSYVVGSERFGEPVVLPGPPPLPQAPVPMPDGYPAQPPVPPGAQPPLAWTPQPTTTPPPPATPHPGTGPAWDPERRAYLQWDPARQQWLQFDQSAQEWQQYDAATGRWRAVDR
jgi:uncharacterized RDD family membrane protein YckC